MYYIFFIIINLINVIFIFIFIVYFCNIKGMVLDINKIWLGIEMVFFFFNNFMYF